MSSTSNTHNVDVNLERNVATGAYPIARMPLGIKSMSTDAAQPY